MSHKVAAFTFFTAGAVLGITAAIFYSHFPIIFPFPKSLDELPPLVEEEVPTEGDERDDVPANAPDHCPGVCSNQAGKAEACAGCPNQTICASGVEKGTDPTVSEIKTKLSQVGRKILVLSGKGGVGKSTVSTQVAWSLVRRGYSVGLLDIDICGPSIPRMTGSNEAEVHSSASGWSPVYVEENFAVMSIGFLLPNQDDAIIWRGPKKNGLIRQFLTDVTWGEVDFLLIDTPPGTSDEHLSIVTYLAEAGIDGALVVTTPQEVALQDVRKEITFCKKTNVKVLGVVENMTGSVFTPTTGGAKAMAEKMEVPMAGSLPLTSELLMAAENGKCVLDVDPTCLASTSLKDIVDNLLRNLDVPSGPIDTQTTAPAASDV